VIVGHCWNDSYRQGKQKYSEDKTCLCATLLTTQPTQTDLKLNPVARGDVSDLATSEFQS